MNEMKAPHRCFNCCFSCTFFLIRSNCINVLVSSNQLVLTLTKLLLFGLGEHFPIENVYSSHRIGKESCFERVLNKFGKKCTYIVVGGSKEDESSSKAVRFLFSIPFVLI